MSLFKRGQIYWYKRRVPAPLQDILGKKEMRVTLRTTDLKEAEARAAEVKEEFDLLWRPMLQRHDVETRTEMHLRAAARLMGLPYRSVKSLMRDPEALAQRILDMPANPTETQTAAALGLAKDDDLMLSQLFTEFERIKQFDNRNKAPDQLRKWRKPRIKALRNLTDVVGDMPISNFERSHALEFKKSLTAKVQAGEIKASSANKDFIHLLGMWNAVSDEKMLELPPVFARLSFRAAETGKRPAFSDNWIRNVLLKDGAFDALNDEARDVFLGLINTGCRPSEIANLTADQIRLDHNIPHISIQPVGREVKSKRAIREIRPMPVTAANSSAVGGRFPANAIATNTGV